MLSDSRTAAGWRTALPMLLTLATVIPVLDLTDQPAGYAGTAAAVSLTVARPGPDTAARDRLVRLPVAVALLAALGPLLEHAVVAGDAVVVAVVLGSLLARRAGPRGRAAGRAALMPLFAMLVTPVPATGGPVRVGLAVLVVAAVALAWSALVAAGLPGRRPATAALRRAAGRRRVASLHDAARDLDGRLPPDAVAARAALLRVQVDADAGRDTTTALDALDAELAAHPPETHLPAEPDPEDGPPPVDAARAARRARVVTSLALQSAVAVGLGLAAARSCSRSTGRGPRSPP